MMLFSFVVVCFGVLHGGATKRVAVSHLVNTPTTTTSLLTKTKTVTNHQTETHYDTIVRRENVYYTRYATIKSEVVVPETTVVQTHFQTIHSDFWTTVTPPTITSTVTKTESHYKTTMTLPIQTEVIERYIPPAESTVIWRFIGNLSFIILFLCVCGHWFSQSQKAWLDQPITANARLTEKEEEESPPL